MVSSHIHIYIQTTKITEVYNRTVSHNFSPYICTKVTFFCHTVVPETAELRGNILIHCVVCLTCLELMPGIFSGPAEDRALRDFFFILRCMMMEHMLTPPERAKPGNNRKILRSLL